MDFGFLKVFKTTSKVAKNNPCVNSKNTDGIGISLFQMPTIGGILAL
jgi:hypothetical protein